MNFKHEPFVSIITPAYNSQRYLHECIESVVNQTYQNWEYVVVNNCSTDNTYEIAQKYADADERIRVHNNKEFLKIIPNWNNALRQMSPKSKYCKIVHADDFLFPDCLEKMVGLAEEHPKVGLIGAYKLVGNHQWGKVRNDGLPYNLSVLPGHKVCRHRLRDLPLEEKNFSPFGSPSNFLIPSDIIRNNDPFYDESFVHADLESYYKILRDYDFGFVHQVLTFTRLHEDSQSVTLAQRLDTRPIEDLRLLQKHGPLFLENNEYEELFRSKFNKHKRYLARKMLQGKSRDLFDYQNAELKKIGCHISKIELAGTMALELCRLMFLNPITTLKKLNKIEWFTKAAPKG